MIKKALCVVVSLSIFLASGCATTGGKAPAGASTLVAVQVLDGAVELRMDREFTSSYTVYKPADPFLVVVELQGVKKGELPGRMVTNKPGITEIRFVEVESPARLLRVELVMDSASTVEPEKMGTSLLLRAVKEEAAPALPEEEGFEEAAAPPARELPPAANIIGIAFEGADDKLKFTVKGDGAMEPEIFTLEGRIIVDVPGVAMKAAVPDTVVYPVKAVRYGVYDTKVRVVLDLQKDVDFVASSVGDAIIISIPLEKVAAAKEAEKKPKAAPEEGAGKAPPEAREKVSAAAAPEEAPEEEPIKRKKYTGKLISLDFQDADIVPIFRFLGDVAGYNVVIHPSVKGKITLKLLNVPWDQAMDIILEISNLDSSVEDNILRIAPLDVFAKQKEEQARLRQIRETAADLVQQAVHLKHIDAREMDKRIKDAKVMSPRGTTRIDERTNTLIINDVEDNIKLIVADEVPYWDTPEHGTMQVLIEARLVEVDTEYSRELGIRWGGSATDANFSFVNDASSMDVSVNTPVKAAGPSAIAPGGLINIGYTETFQLSMSLEAMESVSHVKQLANPRVLTIDKQAATIRQGTQIPFSTVSSEGTKTEFKEAELRLDVTPEIQPNGILKLTVTATNNTPTPVGNETGINTQEVNTQALVKDGQTLVLGGIYQNTETELEVRVPWLSQIPFLGWLFKTQKVTKSPKELLIFITPKIVK